MRACSKVKQADKHCKFELRAGLRVSAFQGANPRKPSYPRTHMSDSSVGIWESPEESSIHICRDPGVENFYVRKSRDCRYLLCPTERV